MRSQSVDESYCEGFVNKPLFPVIPPDISRYFQKQPVKAALFPVAPIKTGKSIPKTGAPPTKGGDNGMGGARSVLSADIMI